MINRNLLIEALLDYELTVRDAIRAAKEAINTSKNENYKNAMRNLITTNKYKLSDIKKQIEILENGDY